MKRILFALLFSGIFGGAYAQDQKNVVQAGIGFGTTYSYGEFYGMTGLKGMPTLHFAYERMLPYKVGPGYFGAGLVAAYRNTKSDLGEVYDSEGVPVSRKYKYSNALVALRGAYHLNNDLIKIENLDLYGALQLGVRFSNSRYEGSAEYGDVDLKYKDNNFHVGFVAGARYYFTKGFGAFSEIGYDVTWIKLGIAGRF